MRKIENEQIKKERYPRYFVKIVIEGICYENVTVCSPQVKHLICILINSQYNKPFSGVVNWFQLKSNS